MKAVVIYEAGGPEQLIYTDVPTPAVKEGWSLVKVKGFGINHSEIYTRKGESPSVHFPRILGIECVGVIAESSDPINLPAGKRVVSIMGEMGRAFDGSYAEYVLLPNDQIYVIDTDLPWDELASIPETYYTAYGSLLNLHLEKGMKILVRGATSGVGQAFLKLVKGANPDAYVVGTSRRLSKKERLLEAGFDDVIIDDHNVLHTDERFDRILELIGPASLRDTFKHTNENGIVCVTGLLGNIWTINNFDPITELPVNGFLTSFNSANVTKEKLQSLFDYLKINNIHVKPEKIFSLKEVSEAHRYIESEKSFGKIIILNDEVSI